MEEVVAAPPASPAAPAFKERKFLFFKAKENLWKQNPEVWEDEETFIFRTHTGLWPYVHVISGKGRAEP